jgi:hypothetical protein
LDLFCAEDDDGCSGLRNVELLLQNEEDVLPIRFNYSMKTD